ncbi:diguanylate cyclase [Pseudomonas gessardii]|nr:diguanylate cyclase [Pseudomonas gessardii]
MIFFASAGRLPLKWERARRSTEPWALLMIGTDHCKAFTDRHGHQGGGEAWPERRNKKRPPEGSL